MSSSTDQNRMGEWRSYYFVRKHSSVSDCRVFSEMGLLILARFNLLLKLFSCFNFEKGGLSTAMWIALLGYIPALLRQRAVLLPMFLSIGLAFVIPPASYVLWPFGLLVLIACTAFYKLPYEYHGESGLFQLS